MLLARHQITSVPWNEIQRWSAARRQAALIVVGESNGGQWDHRNWVMDWPKP